MRIKIKSFFVLSTVITLTVSCRDSKNLDRTDGFSSSLSSVTSSGQGTSSRPLEVSDLTDIEKLLLQAEQANQEAKDLAADLLGDGKEMEEQDKNDGLHGGRSGLSRLFCASATSYPTFEALEGCAEALVLEDGGFDVKVGRFDEASKIYQTALVFSERTDSAITPEKRRQIEENVTCLNVFVQSPDRTSPGCELIEVSLLKP